MQHLIISKKNFLFITFLLLYGLVYSQEIIQIAKRTAPDRNSNDLFSFSTSMSGDFAIIGNMNDGEDENGLNTIATSGSATILSRNKGGINNWGIVKKLIAPDRASGDIFGYSVAISGDFAIVGACNEDEDENGLNPKDGAGSVYVFNRNQGGIDNWGFVKKIVSNNRTVGDRFGIHLDISDSIIVVSADKEDDDENELNPIVDAGAVYIYYKNQGGINNWGFVKKIVATNRTTSELYGRVCIHKNQILVSAVYHPYDKDGLNYLSKAGAVFLYEKDNGGNNNWGLVKKLTAPTRRVDGQFGSRIDLSDDFAAVSMVFDNYDESENNYLSSSGSAFLFGRNNGGINNWGLIRKICPNDRSDWDEFGYGCSLNGDYLFVGAHKEDRDLDGNNIISQAGSGYIFYKNEGGINHWGQIQEIVASKRCDGANFGISSAFENITLIVGAHQDDYDETGTVIKDKAGAVYIFDLVTQARNINAIASTNTVSLTWTNGTSANRCVFIKQDDEGLAIPENTHTYAADTVFGMGSQINTSGWYCVYKGSGSSVEVSELKAGKSYRVMVCEYDGSSGSEIYKLTTANNNPINFITDKYSQSINFNPIATKTWGDSDFYLPKNASSGLKITYSTSNNGIVSISGDTAHIVAAGSCTIYANQAGDSVYFPAQEVQQIITVNTKDLTITAVNKQKYYGEILPILSYSSSAMVYDDTLSEVTLNTAANELSDAGTYDIIPSAAVFQKGNAANYTITYTKGILKVLKSPQQISFLPIPVKKRKDDNFELNASVLSGLPISYVCSDTSVAFVSINTVYFKKAGTVTITAKQEGNHNFEAATDVSQTLVINYPQSISLDTLPDKTWGDPDFYLPKNASSGLKIAYSSSNSNIVAITGDTAHIVAAGSCTIFANQAGDTAYFPAPEIQQSILVNKKDLTVTAVNKQKFYGELLPVFSYNTSSLAYDDAISKVSFHTTANELSDAGSYDINPSEVVFKKGNAANYTITYTKGILEILKSPQQISFFPIPEKRRGDPNFELNASVLSGLPIRFVCSDTNVATIDGNTVIIKNAGTATITATQEGNHNFAAATEVSQTLSVLFPKKISSATIDVSIFPNPAQNSIYIQATGINIISVTILDMLGRTVFSSHHEINTINVSALHPGIYHIKIQTAEHCLVRQFQKL